MVGGNDDGRYLKGLILGAIAVSTLIFIAGTWDIIADIIRDIIELSSM